MDLANLVVEQVITGFHALMWCGLFILAFTGYQNIDWGKVLTLNLALPALVIAYILGIVIDKLTDDIFNSHDHRIREKFIQNDSRLKDLPSWLQIRFHILDRSKDIYEQLEYIRSRIRITRCGVVNFIFTTIAAILFFEFQLINLIPSEFQISVPLIILVIGMFIICATYRAWFVLTKSYYFSVLTVYRMLDSETQHFDYGKNKSARKERSKK